MSKEVRNTVKEFTITGFFSICVFLFLLHFVSPSSGYTFFLLPSHVNDLNIYK